MVKDLVEVKEISSLIDYMPEHKGMLETIKASHPEIARATSLFGKRQSQYMDNVLTVSKPTPIRNLRQITAEMNSTRQALVEAYHNCRRKEVERKMALRDAEQEQDELKRELRLIDAEQKSSELEQTKLYISGAIRKMANYTAQYNSILASLNVKEFSEIDFEAEEERYHIMTAFKQALNAARSRGGMIDEGNQGYFTDIGVNGTVAQKEVTNFLNTEARMAQHGQEPTYMFQLEFLEKMATKFEGCSRLLAQQRGMTTFTKEAALERGDTRLLGGDKDG